MSLRRVIWALIMRLAELERTQTRSHMKVFWIYLAAILAAILAVILAVILADMVVGLARQSQRLL